MRLKIEERMEVTKARVLLDRSARPVSKECLGLNHDAALTLIRRARKLSYCIMMHLWRCLGLIVRDSCNGFVEG